MTNVTCGKCGIGLLRFATVKVVHLCAKCGVAPPEDPGHEGVRGDPARVDEHGQVETGMEDDSTSCMSNEDLGRFAVGWLQGVHFGSSVVINLGHKALAGYGAAIRKKQAGE